MNLSRIAVLLVAAILLVGAPAPVRADGIVVFAAASLRTALDGVVAVWSARTGEGAVVSYAGSAVLARQIQEGAPADVFISASPEWMDALAASDDIQPETRRDLLGNRLVLIAHGAAAPPVEIAPGFDLAGLLGDGRLAMALVDSVPAGIYGRTALEALGVWETVAPKVAQADNVRAALALVARGEAPMGIVYATDARAEAKVSVIATFPADSHPPIVYPVALTASGTSTAVAGFLAALDGPEARAIFERQGFAVLRR